MTVFVKLSTSILHTFYLVTNYAAKFFLFHWLPGAHLDLSEGGQHRDAPLHRHRDGGVHTPRECYMDQGEKIG